MANTKKEKTVPAQSAAHAVRPEETVTVSDDTLEETTARALDLLKGIGKNPPVRAILSKVGYTQAEHSRGWDLLQRASGFTQEAPVAEEGAGVATEAIVQLDAWDERGFATASAALKHRHPDQHRHVFTGLRASQGAEAVVGVALFLDRLDELESGAARKATRVADQAALATLAARGLTPAERQRLRGLVKQASLYEDVDSSAADRSAADRLAFRSALLDLRAWYEEWSSIARVQVTRKEYLIRLGLSQRKKVKKGEEPRGGAPTGQPRGKAVASGTSNEDTSG